MTRPGFAFSTPIKVRYAEIDGQKVVFNSRYLEYADVGLTEFWRIGGDSAFANGGGGYFTGSIDEPAVYIGTALTAGNPANWGPVAWMTVIFCGIAAASALTARETFRVPKDELGLKPGTRRGGSVEAAATNTSAVL